MYREPHADHDGMKVWLSAAEVEQFIAGATDTDRRIAFGLAFRSGLRAGEIVGVAPEHADRGPQGSMLRIPASNAKGGKYREMPLPPTSRRRSRPSTTSARSPRTPRCST